jgi:hypothetical protein
MGIAPALSARNELGGAGSFGVNHPAITAVFGSASGAGFGPLRQRCHTSRSHPARRKISIVMLIRLGQVRCRHGGDDKGDRRPSGARLQRQRNVGASMRPHPRVSWTASGAVNLSKPDKHVHRY